MTLQGESLTAEEAMTKQKEAEDKKKQKEAEDKKKQDQEDKERRLEWLVLIRA